MIRYALAYARIADHSTNNINWSVFSAHMYETILQHRKKTLGTRKLGYLSIFPRPYQQPFHLQRLKALSLISHIIQSKLHIIIILPTPTPTPLTTNLSHKHATTTIPNPPSHQSCPIFPTTTTSHTTSLRKHEYISKPPTSPSMTHGGTRACPPLSHTHIITSALSLSHILPI